MAETSPGPTEENARRVLASVLPEDKASRRRAFTSLLAAVVEPHREKTS